MVCVLGGPGKLVKRIFAVAVVLWALCAELHEKDHRSFLSRTRVDRTKHVALLIMRYANLNGFSL